MWNNIFNARVVFYTIFFSFLAVGVLYFSGYVINVSKSYPLGLYKKVEGVAGKGDMVVFCLERGAVDYLKHINKMPFNLGECATHISIMKTIYAVSGDVVSLGKSVSINGVKVENSHVKKRGLMDKYINAPNELFRVGKGEYFLLSNQHPDSFDSRYFGVVKSVDIISKVEQVWLF